MPRPPAHYRITGYITLAPGAPPVPVLAIPTVTEAAPAAQPAPAAVPQVSPRQPFTVESVAITAAALAWNLAHPADPNADTAAQERLREAAGDFGSLMEAITHAALAIEGGVADRNLQWGTDLEWYDALDAASAAMQTAADTLGQLPEALTIVRAALDGGQQ